MDEAGTKAVSCWPLTKFVVIGVPFQSMTELERKLLPVTVSGTLDPPAATEAGEIEFNTGVGFCVDPETALVFTR